MRPRERNVITPEQSRARLALLDPEDRPLWATAFYSGLRRGELIALKWTDVDLATGVIHVRHGWDAVEGEIEPKSRKGKRKVPIPAVLRDYLLELRMSAPTPRDACSPTTAPSAGGRNGQASGGSSTGCRGSPSTTRAAATPA